VSPHNLRTADYSDAARKRLADAVSQARRAIGHEWRTTFALEAKIGASVFASDDAREGPRAFAEKRRPHFRDA